MNKKEYIRITNEKLSNNCKKIMLAQIEKYYNSKNIKIQIINTKLEMM